MTGAGPTAAAETLARVLEQENAALARLDFAAAGALLARKSDAVAQVEAAGRAGGGAIGRDQVARLAALTDANRRLLERAILVQGRVIGTIARAAPRAWAGLARGYGRDGGLAPPRAAAAVLSARA